MPQDGETIALKGAVKLYDSHENAVATLTLDQARARVSTLGVIRLVLNDIPKSETRMTLCVEGDLAKFVTPERNWHLSASTAKRTSEIN